MDNTDLLRAIEKLKTTMISVSTGGPRIGEVSHEFAQTYDDVSAEFSRRKIENPFPYRELWEWYGRWSSGDMPNYLSRRKFVNEIAERAIDRIKKPNQPVAEPTGWHRVDKIVTEIRERLASAETDLHFQSVGLLARELMIALGKAVYVADQHKSIDGVEIGKADFKRMIAAYISSEFSGSANKELRKYANSALDAANELQHNSTATFRDAAICVEVTTSMVNIIAIMAGVRDPD